MGPPWVPKILGMITLMITYSPISLLQFEVHLCVFSHASSGKSLRLIALARSDVDCRPCSQLAGVGTKSDCYDFFIVLYSSLKFYCYLIHKLHICVTIKCLLAVSMP
jgi:hypothetical protein